MGYVEIFLVGEIVAGEYENEMNKYRNNIW